MPTPSVVASDLDGTLLRTDGHVARRTRAALRRAQGAGATVVFVTGRPPRWLAQVARETRASGLAICMNGAVVYDLGRGEVVREHTLTPDVATRLVAALRDHLPGATFAVEGSRGFGHEPAYVPGYPSPDHVVAELPALLGDPLAKLLVRIPDTHPAQSFDAAAAAVGAEAVVTYSGDSLLEISAAGISKATALEALCAERGTGPDAVVAFGDMPNDVPMLRWAGLGVAMANAHPDALAAADEVTVSNDRDGVAVVLERLFPRPARGLRMSVMSRFPALARDERPEAGRIS